MGHQTPQSPESPDKTYFMEQLEQLLTLLTDPGPLVLDPENTYIDPSVRIELGAVIEPGTHLRGNTVIGGGSRIGPNAILRDVQVGQNCVLESCTITESTLGNGVEVGPYSTVRPGCVLGDKVHIGTHAELKNARLGLEVQVGHFSYLGDCEIGEKTNIGAGAITCNYDGEQKHRTTIGKNAFIGSGTKLIAPVSVGDNGYTGAGAVVNKEVPANKMALGVPARIRSRSKDPAQL